MGEERGILKQLKNPAYGLIPMFVFALLVRWGNPQTAMIVGLALSVAGFFPVRKHSRMLYDISAIVFSMGLFLQLFYGSLDAFGKSVLVEVLFVLMLILSRLTRSKVIFKLAKNDNSSARNYLSESFRVASQTQYGLFFHLMLLLLHLVVSTVRPPFFNAGQLLLLFPVLLLAIIVLEVVRLRFLNRKLRREEWLPVVNESGDVTGKVAKSVTKEMRNRFMHPVVRVALINNGKIYLKERDLSRLLNPGMLDHPFEKYMYYKHDIHEAVCNAVRKEIGSEEIPLRFLLKYVFENSDTKRLIFLYASIIDDDEKLNRLCLHDGKLWTVKQIEDNRNSNLFSECFELEYEYLKNTVLLNCKSKPVETF